MSLTGSTKVLGHGPWSECIAIASWKRLYDTEITTIYSHLLFYVAIIHARFGRVRTRPIEHIHLDCILEVGVTVSKFFPCGRPAEWLFFGHIRSKKLVALPLLFSSGPL